MMKKIKHGELSTAAEAKTMKEKMSMDPNKKVMQGDVTKGEYPKNKSKSKVDASIFKMAEQRDY